MDIKIVDSAGNEEKPQAEEPMVSEKSVSAPVTPELEMNAVAQVMGLEEKTDVSQYRDDLELLLDFAKSQTDDHSLEGLKWAIRDLEFKLGTPPLAEKKIKYMARYAYLAMENSNIKKEMEKFEHK